MKFIQLNFKRAWLALAIFFAQSSVATTVNELLSGQCTLDYCAPADAFGYYHLAAQLIALGGHANGSMPFVVMPTTGMASGGDQISRWDAGSSTPHYTPMNTLGGLTGVKFAKIDATSSGLVAVVYQMETSLSDPYRQVRLQLQGPGVPVSHYILSQNEFSGNNAANWIHFSKNGTRGIVILKTNNSTNKLWFINGQSGALMNSQPFTVATNFITSHSTLSGDGKVLVLQAGLNYKIINLDRLIAGQPDDTQSINLSFSINQAIARPSLSDDGKTLAVIGSTSMPGTQPVAARTTVVILKRQSILDSFVIDHVFHETTTTKPAALALSGNGRIVAFVSRNYTLSPSYVSTYGSFIVKAINLTTNTTTYQDSFNDPVLTSTELTFGGIALNYRGTTLQVGLHLPGPSLAPPGVTIPTLHVYNLRAGQKIAAMRPHTTYGSIVGIRALDSGQRFVVFARDQSTNNFRVKPFLYELN